MSPSTERILVELEDIAQNVLAARFGLDFLLASCETDDLLQDIAHVKGLMVLASTSLVETAAKLKRTDQDAA